MSVSLFLLLACLCCCCFSSMRRLALFALLMWMWSELLELRLLARVAAACECGLPPTPTPTPAAGECGLVEEVTRSRTRQCVEAEVAEEGVQGIFIKKFVPKEEQSVFREICTPKQGYKDPG